VVLVDNFSDNWSKWLADHSDVAGVLRDYRLVATINDIEIRTRELSGCRTHAAASQILPKTVAMHLVRRPE
jgi:hypothetical protein